MEITEVKARLVEDQTERLRAFCTITFDNEFVVRDIKIIDGAKGLFVAMPSRKLTDHCPRCGAKNHLRGKYCNECGTRLPGKRTPDPEEGGGKLHVDIAHPINAECRARIQKAILEAFQRETEKSRESGGTETQPSAPRPRAQKPPDRSTGNRPSSDDRPFGAGIV